MIKIISWVVISILLFLFFKTKIAILLSMILAIILSWSTIMWAIQNA
jgi:hypothetical protein